MGGTWQTTTNYIYGSAQQSRSRAATGHTGSNGNYRLQSIKSATKSQNASQLRSRNSTDGFERPRKPGNTADWRPGPLAYQADITGKRTMDMDAQSGQSHESVNSQANIIKKETHWKVHHQPNNDARAVRQRDSPGIEMS
jgi:hypothetical protein